MKTIYKYTLRFSDRQTVQMPANAQILSIQNQTSDPVIWAVVDTDQPMVERRFHMFGTGMQATHVDNLHYLASVQFGPFVWHFFEEPRCACSPPCIPWHGAKEAA